MFVSNNFLTSRVPWRRLQRLLLVLTFEYCNVCFLYDVICYVCSWLLSVNRSLNSFHTEWSGVKQKDRFLFWKENCGCCLNVWITWQAGRPARPQLPFLALLADSSWCVHRPVLPGGQPVPTVHYKLWRRCEWQTDAFWVGDAVTVCPRGRMFTEATNRRRLLSLRFSGRDGWWLANTSKLTPGWTAARPPVALDRLPLTR